MKKIFLCANRYTDEQSAEADRLAEMLRTQGFDIEEDPSACDLAVSLGGDGAVLRAAKTALGYGLPLIGINAGRLGYLCALRLEEAEDFGRILEESRVEERLVLEADTGAGSFLALNDIVTGKSYFGRPVDLEVSSDGKKIMEFRGDGLIAATPTGCTAYSRNAGGFVLEPGAEELCLTPICAAESPAVLGAGSVIEVRVLKGSCDVFADGEKLPSEGGRVVIRRAPEKLRIHI